MINKEKAMRLILGVLIIFLVLHFVAQGQDRDGDGIMDNEEIVLGTNPDYPETLDLIFNDRSREEGDESVSRDNYWIERDITKVYFGNISQNRYLWRIEFAAPYVPENSILILYLDSDNNPETGRRDNGRPTGIDYMLIIYNGNPDTLAFAKDGSNLTSSAPRIVIEGERLYICKDLDIHQEDGKSVYRASVLSETVNPYAYVDSTLWFTIKGQGVSERKKMFTIEDVPENEGVEVTWGLDLIEKAKSNKENIIMPIGDCTLEGFLYDIFTEYRAPSVRKTAAEGTITMVTPKKGRYYFGFIFYDGPGDEKIVISIDGTRKGVAVANADNNRQCLFFLSEPYEFKGGEKIELKAARTAATYRTEDLILLKRKPPVIKLEYKFRDIYAEPLFSQDGKVEARLTWITTWPAVCQIEYGPSTAYGNKVVEEMPFNNHRVILTDLNPDQTYHYRIRTTTPEGRELATGDKTFNTRLPTVQSSKAMSNSIPLTIENTEEFEYTSWPITCGIPFPEGDLTSPENLRLLDEKGKEIPCQVSVLGYWPDRSIKWALLDFQGDVKAKSKVTYRLEYGHKVKRKALDSPLKVLEDRDSISLFTGPMKLSINKHNFGLLGKLWLDLDKDGKFADEELISDGTSGIYLTDVNGTVYTSLSVPEEIRIEEKGPLRAVIKITGQHRTEEGKLLFTYVVRIHAFAGKSYLRVFHTFGNDFSGQEFANIKTLSLKVPLALSRKTKWQLAGDEILEGELTQGVSIRLFQNFDDNYTVYENEVAKSSGKRAKGWANLRDAKWGLIAAVRDFWQHYPKSLSVREKEIEIGICPPLKEDEYAAFKGTDDEHKLYFYLQNGQYKFRQGVTKTHELLFYFHESRTANHEPPIPDCFQNPILVTAPPEWYCDTKVFGDILPATEGKFPEYEEMVSRALESYLQSRERTKEYGMLNFGDWWGEREINWGNIEYDTQYAFLLQFARSGDKRFFSAGEEAERHNRDVDTVHYHSDKSRIGGVYAHCIGHTGDYYRTSPREGKGTVEGGFSVCHTWVEGHLAYYFLTGDRRSLETAQKIADRYDSYGTTNYDFTNCRLPGWHLILTMAMYNATNDRYYLNAAKIIIERVLERQTPDGGWRRQLMPGHCYCLPRHQGNAGFMVGILLSGLKKYHEVTKDPRIIKSILAGSHFLINDMWVEEKKGFAYTSCPKTKEGAGPWSNFLLFEGMAYAHRFTGDKKVREILLKGTDPAIKSISGFGKSFTQYIRAAPHILYDMARIKEAVRVSESVKAKFEVK